MRTIWDNAHATFAIRTRGSLHATKRGMFCGLRSLREALHDSTEMTTVETTRKHIPRYVLVCQHGRRAGVIKFFSSRSPWRVFVLHIPQSLGCILSPPPPQNALSGSADAGEQGLNQRILSNYAAGSWRFGLKQLSKPRELSPLFYRGQCTASVRLGWLAGLTRIEWAT
ncbi:hypothetical protein VTG60DRAFT_1240 [Thermothelomyces hinnuleus]